MFLVPCFRGSISTFLEFFCPFFCYAVSSCVYDHSHPYLVSECLFLAENKAFPYPWGLRAHPRRLRAILWDAAATCSVVIFVVVAEKKRSPNLSVSWLTLYGLVDRLPVSAGNFRRALQRHFLVDFQTEDIAGKIFSCSKRAYFALVNRARNGWTAFARSLPTHRFHDWSKTEAALQRQRHCSVICQWILKTKISLERSFPALNEHVLLLWIERQTAEQRPLEVCRRIDFAIDRRLRPLASEALQRHLSIDFQTQDIIGKIFDCSERLMFCFCESNEKRLNSVRSKFADASISQLIEDRGHSEVQPSYRLSKVRETCAAFETLTWRKYETKCRSLKRFFFLFLFSRGIKRQVQKRKKLVSKHQTKTGMWEV